MKKVFSVAGMLVGLIVILFGILVLCGSFGGDSSYSSGASYLYDSGYATFGADFYNYVSNNAAEAASAARTAANNLNNMVEFIKTMFGLLFLAAGAFMTCFFGLSYADCVAAETPAATVPAAPVTAEIATPATEEIPQPTVEENKEE